MPTTSSASAVSSLYICIHRYIGCWFTDCFFSSVGIRFDIQIFFPHMLNIFVHCSALFPSRWFHLDYSARSHSVCRTLICIRDCRFMACSPISLSLSLCLTPFHFLCVSFSIFMVKTLWLSSCAFVSLVWLLRRIHISSIKSNLLMIL